MASPAEAQAKWERKMQTADAKYQAAKGDMAANYAQGLQESGFTVGPMTRAAYQAGIASASLANVQGKGAKWLRNTQAGLAR